jgi:hypothetical protein
MTIAAVTAEWICTKCGSSNRKLVDAESTEIVDRCVHCKTTHVVRPGVRPVRWEARAK